jgi:hypothetical protein
MIAWGAAIILLLAAGPALADDCTDSGDCAMAPRNIDAATAIAAAAPFILLGWRYFPRGGAAVARGGAGPAAPPLTAADLRVNIDAAKAEFERLQQQLRDEAFKDLNRLREVNQKYNALWAEAMGHLEDYLSAYPSILPGLEEIWAQFSSREDARRIAQVMDEAIGLASMGAGVVMGTARGAARAAARTVTRVERAAAQAEIQAARRATREALEKDAAAAERAALAAERTAQESVERVAQQAAEREAIEAKARADVENAARIAQQAEADAAVARQAARDQMALEARPGPFRGPYADAPGRASIVGSDDIARDAVERIPPLPGFSDVAVHGNRGGGVAIRYGPKETGTWVRTTNEADLLLAMKAHGYKGGPVRLVSCHAGKPAADGTAPMAERLSKLIKQPVIAPNDTVHILEDGRMVVGPAWDQPTGKWVTFGAEWAR